MLSLLATSHVDDDDNHDDFVLLDFIKTQRTPVLRQ